MVKKIVLALLTIVTFGGKFVLDARAAESFIVSDKNNNGFCPKEKVKKLFATLSTQLAYIPKVGEMCRNKNYKSIGEEFTNDIEATKIFGGGICRQLAYRVIYEMSKFCSRVYPLSVYDPRPGKSHLAAAYEASDGELFVADLTGDVPYRGGLLYSLFGWFKKNDLMKEPRCFAIPIKNYIKVLKDACSISLINANLTNNENSWNNLSYVTLYENQNCFFGQTK